MVNKRSRKSCSAGADPAAAEVESQIVATEASPIVEPVVRARNNKRERTKPSQPAEPMPIQDGAVEALSPAKKPRVNPLCAGIIATLEGAEDLNEHCRAMLVAMTAPSLLKAKGERHDLQLLGVSMIEETLAAHKTQLVGAVQAAQQELNILEESKNEFLQRLDTAKATLSERQATKAAACTAHAEASAATQTAEEELAKAKQSLADAEVTHAAIEREQRLLNEALLEHFKEPMKNGQGPHFNFLKPFMENLGLEESLVTALPSSCVKTRDQRGGFDDLVLSEFEKALVKKQNALEKSVTDEAALVAQTKNGVTSADETVEAKKSSELRAAEALETATSAQTAAEEEVTNASDAWKTFEPRVDAASEKYNARDGKRTEFQDGTFKSFETLRDKDVPMPVPVETEAATAGA
jgi:chromosome segregation ATPase